MGRRLAVRVFLIFAMTAAAAQFAAPSHASEIKYIVDNIPVTSYDIARRQAFLRLQRRKGDASQAMIEQTLQAAEMNRLNITIPEQAVDDAYGRFASGNKMSTSQLDQALAQSGVTKGHFKEYIRVQMGWNQVLRARYRAETRMSEQDAVQRMLQQGGDKPTATEYMLQQVIFVVPSSQRSSLLGKRRREAEAMRLRFNGCDNTRQFAKGLIDVTVRDLGRVLEPALPPDWADAIKATRQGAATKVRDTERGVEFIGICSAREVSDDRVAQMVFSTEGQQDAKAEELSKKYVEELREKAVVVKR
ncbi:peptidylprolyl isomerase [Mesorhizobium xinjiangense]|uniref:peptidylprolyl isomerase n=1 Tax=Mesorhizobium xinjiangense TaxID=2678685 RepID=UPI0012ED9568